MVTIRHARHPDIADVARECTERGGTRVQEIQRVVDAAAGVVKCTSSTMEWWRSRFAAGGTSGAEVAGRKLGGRIKGVRRRGAQG